MWSILWNAIYFQHTIKTHSDLNFSWAKNSIQYWNKNYILHNAGVGQKEAEQYFYKGNYVYHSPFFESFNYVDKKSCSFIYSQAVKQFAPSWQRIDLTDVTFLIPAMIDSDDRLNNLFTVVRYLHKYLIQILLFMSTARYKQLILIHFPKKQNYSLSRKINQQMFNTFKSNIYSLQDYRVRLLQTVTNPTSQYVKCRCSFVLTPILIRKLVL